MPQKVTDAEFIDAWKRLNSPAMVAKTLGIDVRGVYRRRDAIEGKLGIRLDAEHKSQRGRPKLPLPKIGYRATLDDITGHVIIGSDLHAWPGERSVGFDAMVKLVQKLSPKAIVTNGDNFDGARISRHLPGGWANLPSVADELEGVKERLAELEAYAPPDCHLIWPAGNHDSRFTARLAQQAPEYIGVEGFDIADHFPAWQFCWSLWINGHTVVKHRWHQGIHGGYNNVLKSGKNIVTGHTHRLHAVQFADYNGIRFGIECGTLSDYGPESDKFAYGEDAPHNWSQGFVVLSFDERGRLLDPEFCRVIDGQAYFRGERV